jgi:hypothetical protein
VDAGDPLRPPDIADLQRLGSAPPPPSRVRYCPVPTASAASVAVLILVDRFVRWFCGTLQTSFRFLFLHNLCRREINNDFSLVMRHNFKLILFVNDSQLF